MAAVLAAVPSAGLAQIRIASYNLEADISTGQSFNPGTDSVLQAIGTESWTGGFAHQLDIIGLEETSDTQSNAVTTNALLTRLNQIYPAGTYAKSATTGQISGSIITGNGPSSILYNTNTLQLIATVGVGSVSGGQLGSGSTQFPRQEMRYEFRPVGYGSLSTADFYVYVGHYKAGNPAMTPKPARCAVVPKQHSSAATPPCSPQARASSTPATSTSPATKAPTLTAPQLPNPLNRTTTGTGTLTNGKAVDPINLGNGSWNNSNNAFLSAYSDATDSLTSRLDFQLSTPSVNDGHGFSVIPGSYHIFGNNGTTPKNQPATNASNTALKSLSNGTAILTDITTASDHYPIVADYRLPAMMTTSIGTIGSTTVIAGANLTVPLNVKNSAPVPIAMAADTLTYSVGFTGNAIVSGGGSFTGLAAGTMSPQSNTHTLNFDTTTPGNYNSTVNVTTSSQEAFVNGSSSYSFATTVKAHAHPSLAATSQGSLTIDFGTRALNSAALGLGTPSASFSVNNLVDAAGAALSSGLDLDSVNGTGNTSQLTTNLAPTSASIAPGALQSYTAALTTDSFGSFSATYTLNLSDENLPGAQATAPLTISLTGKVALAGDANGDGTVNTLDLNAIATNFGQPAQAWSDGDFDRNGTVDITDFNALAANFGDTYNPSPTLPLGALVPEPSSIFLILTTLLLPRRLRRGAASRRITCHSCGLPCKCQRPCVASCATKT